MECVRRILERTQRIGSSLDRNGLTCASWRPNCRQPSNVVHTATETLLCRRGELRCSIQLYVAASIRRQCSTRPRTEAELCDQFVAWKATHSELQSAGHAREHWSNEIRRAKRGLLLFELHEP